MSREDTKSSHASLFSALYEWERKNGGGGGGKPKMQVQGKTAKLRLGGVKTGVRHFHKGHRLAGTRINNIVKVKFVPNNRDSTRHIIQHIDYIEKRERDINEPERKFYGRDGERSREEVIDSVMKNRGEHAAMFKIILSPKQNELNHVQYTAEIMRRFEEKTGIVTDWSLVEHKNTEYHHVHIVMPGRDMDGNSFRLEKDHLDLLRELANEYQYELQDLVYEREKQIEHEFGLTRDESNMLIESLRDVRDMKDLGVYRPEIDKQVREDLLRPTNFDDVYFCQQIQKQLLYDVAKDFKQLQVELQEAMQAKHPELYQGLIKQLQTEEINKEYFEQLKNLHPVEYQGYLKDPSLDRNQVVDRLRQAFPEWFDSIVENLREHKPELFADYQKPPPTDRQIIDNLAETNPELFPELSKQIQENQKNLFAVAYLAQHNPELFNKINDEPDINKQREMLAEASKGFSDAIYEVEQKLVEKYPDIYKHDERAPTQTEIIADLAKTHPLLFREATAQLQRMEVDNALYERFRHEYPDVAEKFQDAPNLHGIITSMMRANRPDLLEQATAQVKERQPELFTHERTDPTQLEIIDAVVKEKPELFPQAMLALKNQEIDKAYFEQARQTMPDGLQPYVDNPELDRTDLHKLLRNTFPEWRSGIEGQLKEKMPHLLQYDSPRSNQEILNELIKTHLELFPDTIREPQEKQAKAQDPHSAKREQIKEHLIDQAYFERGRERMSDGLQAYLENADFDRHYIVQGLRETFPEWAKEIEKQLKELHPHLFQTPDKGLNETDKAARAQQQKHAAQKLREAEREGRGDLQDNVHQQALLLLALSTDIDRLTDQDITDAELGEPGKDSDKDKDSDPSDAAKNAMADADRFKIGHGWAGLTGFQHGAFIGEPVDLEGEAKILFEDQKEVAAEMQDTHQLAEALSPEIFKIEDIVNNVEEKLQEHEKEKEIDERG